MNETHKLIWTDQDFDNMSWHDVPVHAFSIIPKDYYYELMLDIDYIFEWINPTPPVKHYSFIMAPATLTFTGVWDIETNIVTRKTVLEPLSILKIERLNPRKNENDKVTEWDWSIQLEQGTIKFNGYGYNQYTRRKPILIETNVLSEDQRGASSFGKKYTDI